MARPFTLTAPVVREHPTHKQIADAFRLAIAAPGKISKAGVCWFSTDMAAYAGRVPGIRTSHGCIAGVPDMTVLYRGKAHFIEVKAFDGVLSLEQRAVATVIMLAGACFGTARDATEALALLEAWSIPHRRVA